MQSCYCGSDKSFADCCEPLISGVRQATTAEELMRSRYSAYATAAVDYIVDTTHPDKRDELDRNGISTWAEQSQWEGLEIVAVEGGAADDTEGQVEFIAHYTQKHNRLRHHERASFSKQDGRWYFADGQPVKPAQYVRPAPKVGRNEPCPCGSGKKHKKCCGG